MDTLRLKLKIWRQDSPKDEGEFKTYKLDGLNTHMSFLEMLDVLNEQLVESDNEPVAFDHDCREGICGMCSMVINGRPHGPLKGTTTCQLHMRHFSDGDTITIEPWRANSFPFSIYSVISFEIPSVSYSFGIPIFIPLMLLSFLFQQIQK